MTRARWWPERSQGLYYVVTGMWPVLATDHYMRATGQESHRGVAQALGGAVAALGVALAAEVLPKRVARWAGIGTAAALAAGAVYFAARGRGVPVNLGDAAVQVAFIAGWSTLSGSRGHATAVGARKRPRRIVILDRSRRQVALEGGDDVRVDSAHRARARRQRTATSTTMVTSMRMRLDVPRISVARRRCTRRAAPSTCRERAVA